MPNDRAKEVLENAGVFITDTHVVYASGRHGNAYVNKDAVYPRVDVISWLCRMMVEPFAGRGVTTVVGPAIGGVVLSQWSAFHVARDDGFAARDVRAVYAEKDGDAMAIRRGYDRIVRGTRVLVVEDVLTTGGSARKTVDAARACGGDIVGVAALVNRGAVTAEMLGVPALASLVEVGFFAWDAATCPMCQRGVPVNVEYGHGAAFLAGRA